MDGDRGTNYPQKSDFYNEDYCLFLNTKNVRPDGFNFDTKMFITEEKDKLLRKGKLKRRDVILTTRGTIGNIAIYDESVEFDHIRINSGMLIFRPNENIIKSEYLFEVLRSSIMKSQIERFTSGAAQPQLPIKTLVNFTFPVPKNVEEQSRIVSNLRELYTETQRLETIYRQKLAALNELQQSILQKAFTGELTADTAKTSKEAIAA
ncbi:restriction endonuclease subunit S [Coleofasciculus sp. FACHB-542]|uniref:restriction endonuclease subunit S n=1 Tax=Coleofasciculus sp. FACHB-542 TaxID=2692787 RepID=UPI0032205738